LSVTQFYEALVEQLGLEVEKSEWKTELVFDGQSKAVLNSYGTQKRRKYKLRRINSDSWRLFELFCEHRRAMKERRGLEQETACNDVPTTAENLYKNGGGWNMAQSNTGQEIESDYSAQKLEDAIAMTSNLDESLASTNTQTTESNNVLTTPQKLYESEGGWNANQKQTEQRVEGDFLPRKNELTDEEIQACLKELRQVKTADDYWVLYERSSQLISEAWKLLRASEQLRIQQICDEGIDPLSRWKEGDRCLLWHPFAQEKWGLATVKQVVRGAYGFIYALRDDGFGLHLSRDQLNLMALSD
jgi:hypothetical protein